MSLKQSTVDVIKSDPKSDLVRGLIRRDTLQILTREEQEKMTAEEIITKFGGVEPPLDYATFPPVMSRVEIEIEAELKLRAGRTDTFTIPLTGAMANLGRDDIRTDVASEAILNSDSPELDAWDEAELLNYDGSYSARLAYASIVVAYVATHGIHNLAKWLVVEEWMVMSPRKTIASFNDSWVMYSPDSLKGIVDGKTEEAKTLYQNATMFLERDEENEDEDSEDSDDE